MADVRPLLPPTTTYFSATLATPSSPLLAGVLVLPTLISSLSTAPPKKTCDYNDPLMYIYTSGTTGLPKAAVLKHSRFMFAVYALFTMTLLSEDDVLYSPLPM